MNTEISRFTDVFGDRKLTFMVPKDHETSPEDIDEVVASFVQERDDNPETIKLVGIYQVQGRLALDVFAVGSEATLHQNASRWSALMYPGTDGIPTGHEWSIDSPKMVRRGMVE